VTICVLCLLLLISIYFNIKFSLIILRTEDSIEICLDVLDERYQVMTKILERPVFFDSIEVRQVIEDIKKSRDSILTVANSLGSIDPEAVE
jgi:hypothetical protein